MTRPFRWGAVTALFGGTFDPPHLGHREVVRGLFSAPGVGRVLILPSPNPPHKTLSTPIEHRLAMLKLTFTPQIPDHPSLPQEVEINLCEIERTRRSGGRSYTYDTLLELGPQLPELAFVIGTDQLEMLHEWHRFPDVLALSHWIVLKRGAEEAGARKTLQDWEASGLIKSLQTGPHGPEWQVLPGTGGGLGAASHASQPSRRIVLVPTPALPFSSTQIREFLARTGEAPEKSLTPEVVHYLKEKKLYGT